ncbi:MAG: putative signal peptide peptidase SppA [Chlamydiae bacterium]|nr:putative signal peptide peptidase SppA [Chlamydiota bacterium]
MKIMQDSIFMSSLRAFFTAFFAVIGAIVGLTILIFALYGIFSLADDDKLPATAKVMPDAAGSRKKLDSDTPVLLQISIKGIIGHDDLTAEKIETVLLKSREDELKDSRVKGVLLVIDSPGGGVNDSDIIYRLVQQYKERYNVPVFAYVDGLCASGGYYIACAADKIFASDVSIVGSIGVLSSPFMNVYDALTKIGVNSMTLIAGKGKDEMNPLRPWKPGEQENYQQLVDFFYGRFTEVVTKNRPRIEAEQLVQEYGAKVFPVNKAQELGYVDVGDVPLSDVIRELSLAAGINEDEKYQVISFETKSWWKRTFKEKSPFVTGKIKHELALPQMEGGNGVQYLYSR